MSSFQFLASDKPLQEVKNPYIEFISINEAVKRNIALDDFILEDEEIDRDDKMIMICDSEEHLDEIEISTVDEEKIQALVTANGVCKKFFKRRFKKLSIFA